MSARRKVSAILALRSVIIVPILTISASPRRERGADTVRPQESAAGGPPTLLESVPKNGVGEDDRGGKQAKRWQPGTPPLFTEDGKTLLADNVVLPPGF
ncbi:hypothetical protein POSPLADRAFT_1062888 [Postia placenta MAD-698-R-SB12]|uniref:Uncharacterized protein n=1 Tax=Postia placenta MAD-698-R-SB12 TaxID=670580 RepID=A0A1X6MIL5_9APHY|nr:hypothetical protein POSPLADRAFT_1062888 [Postia placenta MAD-698-R-SB12]OSX56210.1 hypothetical protein POSPLADRAFT_1062888 [Postia placenta MAD-698-R-SB12]